jgi:hypothetical protein
MEIPAERLEPSTLRHLVEEFVSREGTDYGHESWTLQQKVDQVLAQIRRGEAFITYDPDTSSCDIRRRDH